MNATSSIVFSETQRLLRPWMKVLIVVLSLNLVLILGYDFWGGGPLTIGTVLGIVVPAGVLALLWSAKLDCQVREDDLYVRYSPFHWSHKRIQLKDVLNVESKTYSPIKDYGGWGIRCGRDGCKVYNVRGNRGVMLKFVDGKSLLIGSQQPVRLLDAIRSSQSRSSGPSAGHRAQL